MNVDDAIRQAESLLPGTSIEEGIDPRWQAIIAVGEFVESEPEVVWQFARLWGGHCQSDLRAAVATCLLEHLLEYHFALCFSEVERAALTDRLFADCFSRCWQLGQANEPGNAERFLSLRQRVCRLDG